jgi:hypothetical protein
VDYVKFSGDRQTFIVAKSYLFTKANIRGIGLEPLTYDDIRLCMLKNLGELGLYEGETSHCLRSGAAIEMVNVGVPLDTVKTYVR